MFHLSASSSESDTNVSKIVYADAHARDTLCGHNVASKLHLQMSSAMFTFTRMHSNRECICMCTVVSTMIPM